MSTDSIDYSAVLADLEAKRAALDATISHLRLYLSGQSGSSVSASSPTGTASTNGEIPAGAFLAKSIPEAAKLYLQIVKRKATTRDIAEALRRGGMESTSSNFQGIVHAVINRYWKAGGDIVKLDKSTWGLAEWYPSGVRATVQEKKSSKKRRTKNKAPKPKGGMSPPNTEPTKLPLEQQISDLLAVNSTMAFSPATVAEILGVKTSPVALALGRMAAKGKAQKARDGYMAPGSVTEDR
jgi:hypothetical protein